MTEKDLEIQELRRKLDRLSRRKPAKPLPNGATALRYCKNLHYPMPTSDIDQKLSAIATCSAPSMSKRLTKRDYMAIIHWLLEVRP